MADEHQPNIFYRGALAGRDAASLFLGSFFQSLPRFGQCFTWMKYGPANYFMRYDPDYAEIVKKWDVYHNEHARKYAVLPDWPILSIVNDMKSYWHQLMFMKYENNYALNQLDWIRNQSQVCTKAFTPSRDPISWLVRHSENSAIWHHQGYTMNAERRIEERNLSVGQLSRTPRMEMLKHRDNPNDGIRNPQVAGIKPRLLKTEDYGWHANGLFNNLEAHPWARAEMPIFENEEQEKKWMGRMVAYKDNLFGKKVIGHHNHPVDEKFLQPGVYSPARFDAH